MKVKLVKGLKGLFCTQLEEGKCAVNLGLLRIVLICTVFCCCFFLSFFFPCVFLNSLLPSCATMALPHCRRKRTWCAAHGDTPASGFFPFPLALHTAVSFLLVAVARSCDLNCPLPNKTATTVGAKS